MNAEKNSPTFRMKRYIVRTARGPDPGEWSEHQTLATVAAISGHYPVRHSITDLVTKMRLHATIEAGQARPVCVIALAQAPDALTPDRADIERLSAILTEMLVQAENKYDFESLFESDYREPLESWRDMRQAQDRAIAKLMSDAAAEITESGTDITALMPDPLRAPGDMEVAQLLSDSGAGRRAKRVIESGAGSAPLSTDI